MSILRILLIALLSAGFAYAQPKQTSKSQPQKSSQQPPKQVGIAPWAQPTTTEAKQEIDKTNPIVITAEKLFEDVRSMKEMDAKDKYLGKFFRVTGKIVSSISGGSGPLASLPSAKFWLGTDKFNNKFTATAKFKRSENPYFEDIEEDAVYIFEGVLVALSNNSGVTRISFDDCEFVKPEKKD